MHLIDNILFAAITAFAFWNFFGQLRKVMANIHSGRPEIRRNNFSERFQKMMLVAFGQQKMFKKPIPAILHLFVYVGFLVINIELLEILIDGLFGTHRVLSFLGPVYSLLMGVNEILGVIVVIACVVLLWRRNVMKIKRFSGIEMKHTNYVDANIILITEIVLMCALFLFNAADVKLATVSEEELPGSFPFTTLLSGVLGNNLIILEFLKNFGWWAHIIGIYAFLNYIPASKHFHIMMAFPNVFFSKLTPAGKFDNMEQVFHEVKAAFDPSYEVPLIENAPKRFGAADTNDLSWKNLMDAYTCTECGRCTDNCPANITGKKLSPRKIIMDVRDRMEEIQINRLTPDNNGLYVAPNGGNSEAATHRLLSDYYISNEELWACTTCNACVESCPVTIDHLSVILDLRRFLVMEESKIPESWARMFTNIENNGAPWAVSAASRFDWAMDIYMPEN